MISYLRFAARAALCAPLLLVAGGFAPAQAEMSGNTDQSHHGKMMDPKSEAKSITHGTLVIDGAWTRQAPPAATVVGGYASITNNGDAADTLIGAQADFAKRVEIHEMSMKDGVMTMKQLEGGLVIEPGQTVQLKPGSFHIMFMQAKSPKAGDRVDVTFEFEKAGPVVVPMPVAPIGAPHMKHKMKHDMKHGG